MPFMINTPAAIYDVENGCGEQKLSWKRTYPSPFFGSAYRFAQDIRVERAKGKIPGPDAYTLNQSAGPQ
eukprot:5110627-Pyramimonas_sp.AAC.1